MEGANADPAGAIESTIREPRGRSLRHIITRAAMVFLLGLVAVFAVALTTVRTQNAALLAWKQFDIGWVETFPRQAPVAVGTVVAVQIRHLGFWSLNGWTPRGFLATSHARTSRPANRARASGTIPKSLSGRNEARDTLQRCSGMSIYVEIVIRAPMDALWAHTQTPSLHERWDLRFSRIGYLPRALATERRFRYRTRIAFGFEVSGEGETTGQRDLTDAAARPL